MLAIWRCISGGRDRRVVGGMVDSGPGLGAECLGESDGVGTDELLEVTSILSMILTWKDLLTISCHQSQRYIDCPCTVSRL